jgi:hypothetical protein
LKENGGDEHDVNHAEKISKKWNFRRVAAVLHEDLLKEEIERLTAEVDETSGDGPNKIKIYQMALTAVLDGLQQAEKEKCADLSVEWNKRRPPPETQQL